MNLILAADKNWAIGYQGDLLTSLPGDMKYFRKTTLRKTVVMGRKTYESLPGGPLKNRENIILSRGEYAVEGATVVHSVEELLMLLEGKDTESIFVMGGGEIYRMLLPYAKKVYLTKILAEFPADTYFLDMDAQQGWHMTQEGELMEDNGIQYRFCLYERTE